VQKLPGSADAFSENFQSVLGVRIKWENRSSTAARALCEADEGQVARPAYSRFGDPQAHEKARQLTHCSFV
jgi:hypothetical protein